MKNLKTNVLKRRSLLAIIALVAVIGFAIAFVGCDNKDGDDDSNGDLVGEWGGTALGYEVTVSITNTGWMISVPVASYSDYGTYTMNGNTANLYSTAYNIDVGTAEIIDKNTIKIVLNSNSVAPGTHNLTRKL